jgi:predicted N-acetyltransferase YhbS
MDTKVRVRKSTVAERNDVVDLVTRGLAEYRESAPIVHEGYLRYSLQERPGAEQLVAVLDGRIVGSVVFEPRASGRPTWPADVATFQTLVVDPAMRRMGIGALLVRACVDRARATGAPAIVIETMPWLTEATRVYGAHGFERWPAGDWDAAPLIRQLLGIVDAPPTTLSAWRLDLR